MKYVVGGSDPRIKATDLNTPDQITGDDRILELFQNWPIENTEKVLKVREEIQNERKNKNLKRKENEIKGKCFNI